jgi:molybdopterin-guanine dinucleotide biosynthesis protein A
MGTDKALLPLCRTPLIEYSLAILRRAGLPVSISGSRTDLENIAPVLADMDPPQGPLTGICSALHSLRESWIVLLTVDMPLVPPWLIARMLDHAIDSSAAVVLPSFAGRLHPFPCVLHRDLLPGLLAEYCSGRYGCLHAFSAAAMQIGKPIETVALESFFKENSFHDQPQFPIDAWLLNVNRPEDLLQAEQWLAAQFISPVLSGRNLIAAGESPCLP